MCGLTLGGGSRERVKLGVGRLVDVKSRDVGSDLVLLTLGCSDDEVKEVASLAQMRRRRVPGRQSNLFHRLGSRLGGGRD